MAENPNPNLQIHRLPQSISVDAVHWLPPLSAFQKLVALSLSSSIDIFSLSTSTSHTPTLSPLISFPSPSKTTSLTSTTASSSPLIAFSTFSGSFHLLFPDYESGDVTQLSLNDSSFHCGAINGVDVLDGCGGEFVTVGEDGRINLVGVDGGAELGFKKLFDSDGVVSYSAVKWASPTEFASGGLGFSLQWWDLRKPGGPALQFKSNWSQKVSSGLVHSIDIHPSRKHTCMAGGSSGTIFAWDLRRQQQPIILSGMGMMERGVQSPCESEVWQVKYDSYMHSSHISSLSSSRTLPVMACSEDGILAVIEQGIEPIELLAEPCAINCFDIDKQNPSDIICGLEWESVAILTRS